MPCANFVPASVDIPTSGMVIRLHPTHTRHPSWKETPELTCRSIQVCYIKGGSVAEWSARRTCNPAVPGSSLALATCWICARSSQVQILGHACKQPTGRLLPVGVFNPVMLYLNYLLLIFEWSACKLAGQAKCNFHYKQAFNLFNSRIVITMGKIRCRVRFCSYF